MRYNRLIITILTVLAISSCATTSYEKQNNIKSNQAMLTLDKQIQSVGYSSISQYSKYPIPQQRLMAIRAARLNAYRNMSEEIYNFKMKNSGDKNNLIIANNNYRTSINGNGLLKGVNIQSVSPKENGIYEAKAVLNIGNYNL